MRVPIRSAVAIVSVVFFGTDSFALTALRETSSPKSPGAAVAVHHRGHHYRRSYRASLFRQWCAYNCYLVRPGARPPLGAYGYSLYSYDQDIPFPYRYDGDASPLDNGLALTYPITGRPFMRVFERPY
jgi:hypothetical protein